MCHGALGGGVSRSLCLDNYGKALSAAILGFEIEVPETLRDQLRGMDLPVAGTASLTCSADSERRQIEETHDMKTRSMLARSLLALGIVAMAPAAWAQEAYPDRTVKIVVPYPPGGTTDLLARAVAARLTDSLKQTFIVENRGGASGSIGTDAVARAAPDGYTLLMGTISTHGINPAIGKVPYDPVKDFQPVTDVADTPNVLTVNPDTPFKTLADVLKAARAKPGTITFGSTSPGGSPHMSGELLKAMTGTDLLHVPTKAAGRC